jgi:hypothetical protein
MRILIAFPSFVCIAALSTRLGLRVLRGAEMGIQERFGGSGCSVIDRRGGAIPQVLAACSACPRELTFRG